MKIRSSIHAGAQSGCPEAQHYQQKAYAMMQKVYSCVPKKPELTSRLPQHCHIIPPRSPAYTETGVVGSYPDRSGWCG